jgi:hypothetical protein
MTGRTLRDHLNLVPDSWLDLEVELSVASVERPLQHVQLHEEFDESQPFGTVISTRRVLQLTDV